MKNFSKTRFGKILFSPPHFILMFILLMSVGRVSAQINHVCGQQNQSSSVPESSVQLNCSSNFSPFIGKHTLDMVPNGTRNVKIRTNVIFAQDAQGNGNFSTSNPEHMDFWNKVFLDINARLASIVEEVCLCSTAPAHYKHAHIEFVPNFIEVKDNFAWNHRNDPNPLLFNSYNKSYLNYINNLAAATPGYKDGFNAILTTDSIWLKQYNNFSGDTAAWKLPAYKTPVYNFNGSSVWYSAFPTTDLERPAMWHAPDRYITYINGVRHLGGQWWINTDGIPWTAGSFLHEYGHYFGLAHPDENNPSPVCPHNVMMAKQRNSYSGCQVREMYTTLMTKNLRKSIICEDALDFSLNVSTNETWGVNMRVLGDVIVKSGATLTVTCEIHMSPKGKIIVERGGKLIIDGGKITTDCEEQWRGIIVEGDVPGKQLLSGIVELKNKAILEKARTAISTSPDYLPWNNGLMQNYYGGVIQAENSTIRNCNRAVAFMKYAQNGVSDKSWFKNVTFEKLNTGVTIWADDGVEFTKCKFSKIEKRGIYAYDCEVVVNDVCEFEEMPIGVDILTTYPIIVASKIGRVDRAANKFYCKEAGVNIQSLGNIEPLRIFNNIFVNGDVGIKQNGSSLYEIAKNKFDSQLTSLEFYEGGDEYNKVFENEILYAKTGTHAVGINVGLRYNDNCFDHNQSVDIFISDGNIFPVQGSQSVAAGNFFTKNLIPEIDNDNYISAWPIFYYIKKGMPITSRQYPENSSNITLENAISGSGKAKCGITFENISDEAACNFDELVSIDLLKKTRIELLSLIKSNGNSATTEQQLEVIETKACIGRIEDLIARKMLAFNSNDPEAGVEAAIAFFSSQGMSFLNKTTAYGIMLSKNEFGRARKFLNGLETQNQEQIDFVGVQNINIDYLMNQQPYQVTAETKSYLFKVGKTNGALNGYARSLYEVLTGERIEVEIPEVVIPRRFSGIEKLVINADFVIYPNPVQSDNCTLSINKVDASKKYSVFLSDATGTINRSWNFSTNGNHNLNLDHIPSGIYIIRVADQDGIQWYHSKIVITD